MVIPVLISLSRFVDKSLQETKLNLCWLACLVDRRLAEV